MSEPEFPAALFGDGLPPQGASVRFRVRSLALVVVDASGREEDVGYSALRCRAGGWRGDDLQLEWTGELGSRSLVVRDAGALASLRRSAPEALQLRLEPWRGAGRRAHAVSRAWILSALVLLGALAALALLLAGRSGTLVDAAVRRVPVAWERQLGDRIAAELVAGARVRRGGAASRAVSELGATLASRVQSPYALRWLLVDDPQINAMALPGGTVVVYTGLLRAAESPEELAGVLAHEVQHVVRRHSLRALVQSLGWRAALSVAVGGAGELGRDVAAVVENLGGLRFSRQQETEADLEGVRLLQRAGIDAEGLARFFERLAREPGGVPAFLSTHPSSRDRAQRIRALASASPPAAPLAYDWLAVRAELGALPEPAR